MIPPSVIQAGLENIIHRNKLAGGVLLIFHPDGNMEILGASRPGLSCSLGQLLRKAADKADDSREIDLIATPKGGHSVGDVFRVNITCPQKGWVNVLVTATAIHHWGIEAIAAVPTAVDCCAQIPIRLSWSEVDFTGRLKAKNEEQPISTGQQPVVTTKGGTNGAEPR